VQQHVPQLLGLRVLDAVDVLLEQPGVCRDFCLPLSRQRLPSDDELDQEPDFERSTCVVALAAAEKMPQPDGENPRKLMDSLTAKLNMVGLPFGFDEDFAIWKSCLKEKEPFHPEKKSAEKPGVLGVLWNYFRLLVGYALAAILMSMGAPFWWEAINKFINIRSIASAKK
jgi:hypothetical protein